jgi:hypothetical protein
VLRTDPKTSPKLEPSNILDILGRDLFAPFTAVAIPAKVIWCNFELARELGFDVPDSNQMSPKLHEQLIAAFAYRVLRPREDAAGRPTITLYADRYGGDGVSPSLGSGRGGYFPYCNAFTKGMGHTPLHRHDDPDDFEHSHGGLNMFQAFAEAVFSEVNMNLFEGNTTRLLVIIDQNDYTVTPKGERIPRAITIRVGDQLRPGHLLAKHCWDQRSRLDVFLNMTRETGQLVIRNDGAPDLRSTMLRIIDAHARTAAQQARWRVSHRFLSTSNMRMDGGMMDLNTQRTDPRVAPIRPNHSLKEDVSPYTDYMDRTQQMVRLYRTLRRSLSPDRRRELNALSINILKEMDRAYLKYLGLQMLGATGMKSKMARRILSDYPGVAQRFLEVLMKMTEIKNRSKILVNRVIIHEAAVLDVFYLLAIYPQRYFKNPEARDLRMVRSALQPIYKGNPSHIASKRAAVGRLIVEFIDAYRGLMQACQPLAKEYYGDEENMQASIQLRAAFENKPVKLLFRETYINDYKKAIAEYKTTGDIEIFREVVDERITASLRHVEGIMRQGERQLLEDGSLELQVRVMDGIRYAVRAWNDTRQTRCLHVSAPLKLLEEQISSEVAAYHSLKTRPSPRPLKLKEQKYCYKFTIDNWVTSDEVSAGIQFDKRNKATIAFACIPTSSMIGELQGYFYAPRQKNADAGKHATRRYVFALPDQIDLAELLAEQGHSHAGLKGAKGAGT